MKSNIAFIALGSNIGKRKQNIENALAKIKKLPESAIASTSSIIETKPVGNTKQPHFLNCVIKLETKLTSAELLNYLLRIEGEMGRVRKEKWGPRIIDLDILFFNDEIIETKDLTIPHPEILNRAFILQLMNEIAKDYVHPRERKTIEELAGL
ncbi:MAG: 2-amino-4-hydroxy-6-hydroxymethyldihydropteridine diphosphokinase [Candidatus Cloacimonadia bacterium]